MSEKKQKKVLGRGLDALLGDTDNSNLSIEKKKKTNSIQLSLNKIHVNPNQPRTNFDSKEIDNLVVSIKELGIIQPITVRKINDDKYEIISGERRYRASKIANMESIPCYIKAVDDESDTSDCARLRRSSPLIAVVLLLQVQVGSSASC